MERSADCPRCGYDLSGAIQSWDATCPVEGQCSECGLEFHWGDLLHPQRRIPAWFFEHASERRFRRTIATIVRTARPGRFWQDVRLHHGVRVGRIVWTIVLLAIFSQVALGLAAGSLNYATAEAWDSIRPRFTPTWADFYQPAILPQMPTLWNGLSGLSLSFDRGRIAPLIVLAWITPLLLFLILNDTMRLAKVRWVHLLRVGAYSAVPMLILVQMDFLIEWLRDYNFASSFGTRTAAPTGFPVLPLGTYTFFLRAGVVVFFLWLAAWWFSAIKLYMRLPRPWLVFLIMHATAMFATGVLFLAFEVWIRN